MAVLPHLGNTMHFKKLGGWGPGEKGRRTLLRDLRIAERFEH